MVRSLGAGLGLISVLVALILGAFLMVDSLGGGLAGGSAGDFSPAGTTDSVVLRVSGTPGVRFSGNYATPQGSHDFSGTLGAAPTDYKLGGEGSRASTWSR